MFVSGASAKPVCLIIADGEAELRDASPLWGKDTVETEDLLQQQLGQSQWRISCIGPAGESCSLMSGIVNEKGRIAARSGVGAVMGSKRLKAVAVKGDRKDGIAIADPAALNSIRDKFSREVRANGFHQGLSAAGTGGGTSFLVSIGDCPTKNWNSTGLDSMPTCERLNSMAMDKYKVRGYGCHACPIRCGALIQVKEGPFATRGEVHRPEYETLAALGTLCLNDQVESVIKANEICNRYGIDTIAVGGVIAFAMECYENGLIGADDTEGLRLTWGNGEAIVSLTEKIARREGFGQVLADGVRKAAERIGKGSERFAMHVGGRSLPFMIPRLSPWLGNELRGRRPAGLPHGAAGQCNARAGPCLWVQTLCCNRPSSIPMATSTKGRYLRNRGCLLSTAEFSRVVCPLLHLFRCSGGRVDCPGHGLGR